MRAIIDVLVYTQALKEHCVREVDTTVMAWLLRRSYHTIGRRLSSNQNQSTHKVFSLAILDDYMINNDPSLTSQLHSTASLNHQ